MLKTKAFFSSLINLKDLKKRLDKLGLAKEEQDEIEHILEDTLYHRILASLLEILPPFHHGELVSRLAKDPSDSEIINFLKLKSVSDPEVRILSVTEIVKREIIFDIHQTKKRKR